MVFERKFRAFTVERRGLLWDSAFAPARESSGAGNTCVYVVLDGAVTFSTGVVCNKNSLFFATESQQDGESGARAVTMFAAGEPFRSLDFRIDPSLCSIAPPDSPRVANASAATVDAANRILAGEGESAMRAFLSALAASEILPKHAADLVVENEPEEIVRVWSAVQKYYLTIATAPTLQELADAAGISLRQLSRDIEMVLLTFPVGVDGFRDFVSDVRLRWAVTLLSAFPIDDVAREVGYGSVQALGRAFRDAKLKSPGAVKRAFVTRK